MSGKRGAIFYPEHVRVARGLLDDADLGRLFLAVIDYAEAGKTPCEEQKKEWQVCFDLMRGAVDKNAASYQARCEKNRESIRRRWANREETKPFDSIPSYSPEYDGMRTNTKLTYRTEPNGTEPNGTEPNRIEQSRTEGEPRRAGDSSPASAHAALRHGEADGSPENAIDGADLSADRERYDAVERLIKRYRLTDNDATLSALLEDVEAHGLQAVEDALSRAALADTRGGLSVRFYRAVLAGKGRDNSPRGGFTRIPTAEEYAAGAGKDGFGWG